ncbi:molybdenum cofactor guanylyltransferase [Sphingomonas tabacisoli]|uniref:Molybdenum cofactor guanylyltransferase n=1 Tax=Sphingomonas tabacisoli TaxID=2249466 RepID=A0ABW4I2I8_9SPHN
MKVLGAVLAGGRSSRFGSDKALAEYRGVPLIEHAVAALAAQCDAVVMVGRYGGIADWPEPGCGPLGGLAGALRHARANLFDAVLSCGVDAPGVPADLRMSLMPAPAYVASQPVLGLWPVSAADALEEILTGSGRHSMLAFAEAIGARPVKLRHEPANVNTPEDLARLEQRHGL